MDAKISPPQSDLTRGGFIFNLLNSDFFLFGRSYSQHTLQIILVVQNLGILWTVLPSNLI